jgi:hypothetical protein
MNIKLLFGLCVLVRIIMALVIYKYPLQIFVLPLFAIGLSFIYQFIYNPRKKGAFGQSIWWGFLRPIHALAYLLTGIMIYTKNNYAHYVLLIDVFIGIVFHMYYRYM